MHKKKLFVALLSAASILSMSTTALAMPTSLSETITDGGIGKRITILDASPDHTYTIQVERGSSVSIVTTTIPLGEDSFDFYVTVDSVAQVWETEDEVEFNQYGRPLNVVLATERYNLATLDSANTLSAIRFATNPDKTVYCTGEDFDPTGLTLTLIYQDGHEETVTEGFAVVDGTALPEGKTAVTIEYNGLMRGLPIQVLDPATVVTLLEVAEHPTTTSYFSGDAFDPEGLSLTATFRDGHTETITEGFTVIDGDEIAVDQTFVTVEYNGASCEVPITVTDSATVITGIELDTPPTTNAYYSGDDFDPTGMTITVIFRDEHTETVANGFTVTNGESITVDQTSVTVEYQGYTCEVPITVTDSANVVTGIEMATPPATTTYFSGDAFNPEGLTLTATYRDGHTDTITEGFSVLDGDSITVDQTEVTIEYLDQQCTVPITVTDSATVVTGIEVSSEPATSSYYSGDSFDPTGLSLTVTYRDGHTDTITEGFTVTDGDAITVYQTFVTVEYEGATCIVPITVIDSSATITGIEVATQPTTTSYFSGDPFDLSGLSITVFFRDGHEEIIDAGFAVTDGDAIEVDQTTVTVEYEGFYCTVPITVTDSTTILTGIEVATPPTKTEYYSGDAFELDGLTLTATYRDGHTSTITDGFTITDGASIAIGQTTVTIDYEGKQCTASITVVDSATVITGIEVAIPPTTIDYFSGDAFDVAGLTLTVTFRDNHTETRDQGFTVTDGDAIAVGQATVTIEYEGFTCTTPINVTDSGTIFTDIEVKTAPDTTEYDVGDSFDPTGLVLNAIYRDGHKEPVTTGFTITGGESLVTGQTYVTAEYQGETCEVPITVYTATTLTVSNRDQIGYTDSTSIMSIPSTFIGDDGIAYKITALGDEVFKDCTHLASVTIPDTVTSIGESAFSGCTSLNTLRIPNTITSIGDSAFYSCTRITSLTIPDGVTVIEDNTFYYCSMLESVTLSDFVTSIGDNAFYYCKDLTDFTPPSALETIGTSAFYYCSSLEEFDMPSGVTSIGSSAFRYCSSLGSVSIPSGVDEIPQYIFQGCSNLSSIELPATLTSIGTYAFSGCEQLYDIEIPVSVSDIGTYAFQNCASITSVTIPDGVEEIRTNTFNGCTDLTSVTIPASVTIINNYAFANCTSLTTVDYQGTSEQWDEIFIGTNNEALSDCSFLSSRRGCLYCL